MQATQLRKEANKLYGKGDFKAALECCKKADKDKPHDIFILTNLVAAAAASGDFPYAVTPPFLLGFCSRQLLCFVRYLTLPYCSQQPLSL